MSEFGLEKNYRKHTRMCACTEPVRTGIGAVCVEYGRPKWPITMLNRTHNHTNTQSHKHTITHTYLVQKNVLFFIFGNLCSYDQLRRGFFFIGKPGKKRLASLARLMISTLEGSRRRPSTLGRGSINTILLLLITILLFVVVKKIEDNSLCHPRFHRANTTNPGV